MLKATREWHGLVAASVSLEDLELEVERLECTLRAAKADGLVAPDIKERFKRAGLDYLYASMYVSLCAHVHGTQTALALGHHERAGERMEIIVHDEPLPDIMRSYFTLTASVLRESSLEMYGILGVTPPGT
jgi:hypothetical protein